MKIFMSLTILALFFLSACGSENTDTNVTINPVDVWSPFVQVAPPGNIWETRQNEAQSTLPPARVLTRQEMIAHELNKLYIFLSPSQTLGGWFPDFRYPDYFGGIGWSDDFEYWFLFIVEGKEDDAAELVALVEDFQTAKIRKSNHSLNELIYIANQKWSSDVYPELWLSHIDTMQSSIIVYLFNYSEEEKRFFRENVIDSPLIEFVCIFEAGRESIMFTFWEDPAPSLNQLDGLTISAQVQNNHDFMINIYNEAGLTHLYIRNYFLEAQMNSRWIPIFDYFSFDLEQMPIEPGASKIDFNTSHFTRNFEGPFRINLFLEQITPGANYLALVGVERHHLTYIFSSGG